MTASDLLPALWQGLLLFLGVAIVFVAAYLLIYWLSWGTRPHWMEAFRHRYKLWNLPDNRFWPWIHQDTQYWIVRLRFDKGGIVLEGRPPEARYWSIAYYPARENTLSIDTRSVKLGGEGRYRIELAKDIENSEEDQRIRVDEDVDRGIIELRATLEGLEAPLPLPRVTQDGRVLLEERQV